jgi:tetratricopeptide (TPR) repeat protein
MVGAFGEVQVMDWGLAKILGEETPATADTLAAEQTRAWTQIGSTPESDSHTQAGSLVGTPAFIPPEQAVGEIERVNERSDVFGLGALLAVILTGKPPYVGETFDSVRVQAVRGKLEDCFARLDGCGAEPELVALCKKCLAFEPADRPADGGAVAAAVAEWRAAADERARRAELDKVRVEAEKAASEARALERRKRRRLALAASAVLALAVVGGLMAVLAVQQRANARLDAKNHELIDEQAKVQAKNAELADEQAKVQARFELAQKAIALFHTGVSETAEQTGDPAEALAAFEEQRELAERLAAEHLTDAVQSSVASSHYNIGWVLAETGKSAQALASYRQALAIFQKLADANPAVTQFQSDLAASHNLIAVVLTGTWKVAESNPAQALASYRQALAIFQKLADANPAVTQFQSDLAVTHHNIGAVLTEMGKPEEVLASYRQALAIWQKLANANPAVTQFQSGLAASHTSIGNVLRETGKPEEALASHRQALAIWQKLADANPAVIGFQTGLAWSHTSIGLELARTGKLEEALKHIEERLQLLKAKHGPDHPATLAVLEVVVFSYLALAAQQAWLGQEQEWAATCERGLSLARDTKGVGLPSCARRREAFTRLRHGYPPHRRIARADVIRPHGRLRGPLPSPAPPTRQELLKGRALTQPVPSHLGVGGEGRCVRPAARLAAAQAAAMRSSGPTLVFSGSSTSNRPVHPWAVSCTPWPCCVHPARVPL